MATKYVRENVPLSRFGVLVAQLESIVASASQQPPDALLCFDLLSDLISAIDEEPKESILLWQRKCEDALYSLLLFGARRPVRHLASLAMARIIWKGDGISIYSRASSLQGLLSDGKRSEPLRAAGAAQCLGELYRHFGRRITSGLLETANIASKLMRFYEDFVRQEALEMLHNALEGSGGSGASAAYTEAFRLIMRTGVGDKSFIIRIAAAKCLKTFASIGGPGLGITELENSSSYCVKALEDPVPSVRDAFAEALGALLALGMNPEAQVQLRGKGHPVTPRKMDGCLQKHLAGPFIRANGVRAKDLRIGITLSWVFFLQAIRLRYLHPDSELSEYALLAVDMLRGNPIVDAHALACVLYILRVGVTDQMTETTQRSFLVFVGRQLESPDHSPSMKVAALRTLSYILTTLGEVPQEFKEVLDNTIIAALSHHEQIVRTEAALTLRALAEVDPTSVGGLISYAVTIINALRESIAFEKGNNLKLELDALHGQATVLSALVSISPKLPLGYPARLPQSVLDVSKKMLTEVNRNPIASTVQKEAGWSLLASLIASMPKEELEDQVFDILSLWASNFSGNADYKIKEAEDLTSEIRLSSAAIDALTAFIRCYIASTTVDFNNGILLQPVLMYLSRALSYISFLAAKQLSDVKPAVDLLIIRTLLAYQSLSDPLTYQTDHPQILQICTTPFRDPSGCEESSCLRLLLDKRDAWLGPWIPGRDWFEDELRAFEGGKDGLMPCVWEHDLSTFPQPETTNKMLVNQMLLCFGNLFATQDSSGMLGLLAMIEQCLKSGKKQPWHNASVTNICVGLLAGLKALLASRPQPLGAEILSSAQAVFQGILAEGDICAAQRRAASECLGLLARLGSDIFTARLTRSLLGGLVGATDPSYTGSVALSLGCIHRSAGGMALSTLVPATVSSVSLLAKSPNASLQIWSLHSLLLTIEAAGLSYVSQVQGTLLLAMEILLSEENGWVDLRQGIGRLINAIVAALGPELAPGSIFFSRCKSVVAEISSGHETSTLLESVRFTQQLVLFAPQAVSVHSHVQTLLPTLSSKQPSLRHLAVSTLRHLIEKDPGTVIEEQIEENLFHMLDEETDYEIGSLVRATITRLLCASCPSCPSHWISVCRKMILATPSRRNIYGANTGSEHDVPNYSDGDGRLYTGEDDDNMVAGARNREVQISASDVSGIDRKRENHLRYRTRVFAAECLSHLPAAVGNEPAHFDLSLARRLSVNGQLTTDWLVLQIQELIAVAYQISTIQFENMQPIGVELLCTIVEKFKNIQDPDLPGHFLMEQYQAQLVSAVRTSLGTSSSPLLLEAGLHLATKILTSSIISGDQAAIKRIFSLISRPLSDFKDLYYPSFAEWVACKIKIRLLAAHASVKSYIYAFLRRQHSKIPDEYLSLIPQFSNSSSVLGEYWICVLKDYHYLCFHLQSNSNYKSFLDGIQSPLVSSKLQLCLEEAWPVILQAVALDAVPMKLERDQPSIPIGEASESRLISGYEMVKLEPKDFQFLWGFAFLILFGRQQSVGTQTLQSHAPHTKSNEDLVREEKSYPGSMYYEVALLVFQSLSAERFYQLEFLTSNICKELLQVFSYSAQVDLPWTTLVIPVLSQILQVCPKEFFDIEDFSSIAMETCITFLYTTFQSTNVTSQDLSNCKDPFSALFVTLETLLNRFKPQIQMKMMLAFLLTSYNCLRRVATESCFSKVIAFVHSMEDLLKKLVKGKVKHGDDHMDQLMNVLGAWQNETTTLAEDCIESIHLLENKRTELSKLLKTKLSFCLRQAFSLAKLAYETQLFGENKDNDRVNYPLYKYCIQCIKMVLNDSEMQIQAIGLHILKSLAQGELGDESDINSPAFFLFFTAELFGDIFYLAQKMMKNPNAKESMVITGECLRLLFILLTLYKVGECQKGLINLFLEAIAMVVSASADDFPQEFIELRSSSLRLVSHLVQSPPMAVQFKDVLLAMPAARRQQLQDIIRASINLDTNSTQTKPSVSPLIIKIPTPREQDIKDDSEVCASSVLKSDDGSSEEEDDWDAFQSFPATVDASNANSELQTPAADSSVDNLSSKTEIEDNGAQHLDDAEERAILEIRDEGNYDAKFSELQHSEDVTMSSTDHGEHVEAEICEDNEIQVSAELQTLADGDGLRGEKLLKDSDNKIERCDCGVDLRVSPDSLPPECAESTTKAGVANLEGEISVRDYDCANDIQERLRRKESLEHSDQTIERSSSGGDDASSDPPSLENTPETGVESEVLKKEMSVEDSEQKIEKNGSEGNDIQTSPDPLPVEDAPEAGAEAETLKKEMSVEDTEQKIQRDGSGSNDLQASSDPLPHEYAPDTSAEVEVSKKEMSVEDSEQKIEKDGSEGNDIQTSPDPLPVEDAPEAGAEAETLKKEMSVEDSEQKIERDGSGGNDLQASSDPLPHEYAPDASTEVEVLKKEMSMEDSEQKIEKNGSGNNDLQASSDPLPLESTQEPATEAVVPSYRGDELVRDVDYVNDTQDTSYPQSLEDAGREAHSEHGSENSGIIADYPKMEKD